jgi:hypothetical protein
MPAAQPTCPLPSCATRSRSDRELTRVRDNPSEHVASGGQVRGTLSFAQNGSGDAAAGWHGALPRGDGSSGELLRDCARLPGEFWREGERAIYATLDEGGKARAFVQVRRRHTSFVRASCVLDAGSVWGFMQWLSPRGGPASRPAPLARGSVRSADSAPPPRTRRCKRACQGVTPLGSGRCVRPSRPCCCRLSREYPLGCPFPSEWPASQETAPVS